MRTARHVGAGHVTSFSWASNDNGGIGDLSLKDLNMQ
jgi:hypothetical protein